MRIVVDAARCEGHGMCEAAAPDLFAVDEDGVVEYAFEGQAVPEPAASLARFAAGSCPVAALRVQ